MAADTSSMTVLDKTFLKSVQLLWSEWLQSLENDYQNAVDVSVRSLALKLVLATGLCIDRRQSDILELVAACGPKHLNHRHITLGCCLVIDGGHRLLCAFDIPNGFPSNLVCASDTILLHCEPYSAVPGCSSYIFSFVSISPVIGTEGWVFYTSQEITGKIILKM